MSFVGLWRRNQHLGGPSNRVVAFALAVALPFASSLVTARVEALHTIPFALSFVSMAIIASYGGLFPALLSVALSTVANHYLLPAPGAPSVALLVGRPVSLVVSAVVISLMTNGLRRSAAALTVALAKLKEQSSALVESQQASKCASWTYDTRDRTRWYPGGYEVFGIPFDELERLRSQVDLIWPEDQPAVREAIKHMLEGRGPLLIEYRVLWPNGELHWSEARGTPHESDPHVWRGVTFDITDRKLSELALIRSEKLAAMGRLASTIAHEINNPLEAVTNLLYLARRDTSLRSDTEQHLAMAERELARIGEITRLALGFIRISAARRDVEVVDGVEDVLSLFRHRFDMKNIHIERHYEPGVTVNIAPQELRQIATNLISNALDAASPPTALVRIQVCRHEQVAVLLVEDNGSGIADAHLPRVFEPFFSTKDDTGTGIGLWVTRELVEKNGGRISVQSGDLPGGVRTSFRIEFPACPADAGLRQAHDIAQGATEDAAAPGRRLLKPVSL